MTDKEVEDLTFNPYASHPSKRITALQNTAEASIEAVRTFRDSLHLDLTRKMKILSTSRCDQMAEAILFEDRTYLLHEEQGRC